MSQDFDARLGHVLLAAQALALAVLATKGRRARWSRAAPGRPLRRRGAPARVLGWGAVGVGGGYAVVGALDLGPALTPSPRPRAGSDLRTDGAYRHVRHPIYSGLLLAAGGRALSTGRPRHVVAAAALAVVLVAKTGLEERYLRERFADYAAYAARTPRLVPRIASVAVQREDRSSCGT